MHITFAAIGWEQLGISQLSAIARLHGHTTGLAFSVSLFDDGNHLSTGGLGRLFDDRRDVIAAIRRQKPDVLACSPTSGNYRWMLGVAKEAREMLPGLRVIFGGVHATALPERVLARECVDMVCVGEGDVSFPLILEMIEDGGPDGRVIPNTRYKMRDGRVVRGPQTAFVQDLDALPFCDKPLWEDHMLFRDLYITMASRGCPYRCSFCFNSFFAHLPDGQSGKYVRHRSPGHVMAELRQSWKRYRFRHVEFFDDVFTMNKAWLKEFLDEYRLAIKAPFQCFSHVKYLDEDRIRWLSDAGCLSVQIGVQSLDDEFKRKEIHRPEKADEVAAVLKLMKRYKVRAKFDHLLGLPGEPLEAQETARRFYVENQPYTIQAYWVNLFPGTEILEKALDMKLISTEQHERLLEGYDFRIYLDGKAHGHIDPERIRIYKAYELIFKLIPCTPHWIRRRLSPAFFRRIPRGVAAVTSLWIELIRGFLRWDLDVRLYARYYLYHLYRFAALRCKIKPGPASRVYSSEEYAFFTPEGAIRSGGKKRDDGLQNEGGKDERIFDAAVGTAR